jgi:hypothetical protein
VHFDNGLTHTASLYSPSRQDSMPSDLRTVVRAPRKCALIEF